MAYISETKNDILREEKEMNLLIKNYSDNVHDKSGREQDRYQNGVSMKMKENKHCTKETNYKSESE